MTDDQETSHLFPWRRNVWIRVFFLGLGFALVVFLAWFFIKAAPSSPTSKPGEKTPPALPQPSQSAPAPSQGAPSVPVDPTAKLRSQLELVLSGIRQANQQKNLSQILSFYSPNFPQLTQRARIISKTWKIYDYPKMEFQIKEVRLVADNAAMARITWDVEAKNINTQKSKNFSKTYLIRFVRESGQWRIKSFENAN